MQFRFLLLIANLVIALALAACTGQARSGTTAPKAVAEIAAYTGADRQQVLEAGARQEGKLMLYTSSVLTQAMGPLRDAFQVKYPFVKVDIFRQSNEVLVPRIMEEYQAGRHDFDVLETSIEAVQTIKEAGHLEKYVSSEFPKYPKASLDPDGYMAPIRESYAGLGYNTNLVKKEEIPKNLDDLLDPKWKGKMQIAGSATGVRFVGNVLLTKNEDFLRKLADQQIRVQNISGRALADLVIAGEVPLSPTIFDSHVDNSKQQGAPIEWWPLEPTVVNLGSISIAKNAPQPHAAMLFIDFALSQEGQEIHRKAGYGSAREGMGGTATTFKKRYLENDVKDYPAEFDKWQRLLRSVFTQG